MPIQLPKSLLRRKLLLQLTLRESQQRTGSSLVSYTSISLVF